MTSAAQNVAHSKDPGSCFELDASPEGLTSPFAVAEHDFTAGPRCKAAFPLGIFEDVMLNLIKNPNITSSYLFRADLFYDSLNDASYLQHGRGETAPSDVSSFVKHMKPEYRPLHVLMTGWTLERTIVRQLVPRNPQLDKPMVQTCHILARELGGERQKLILYLPHAQSAEEIPYYHPTVRGIGFLYSWKEHVDSSSVAPGLLSIHVSHFAAAASSQEAGNRLDRTLLKLLQTTHKHATGLQNGYQKRVLHDRIVPQQRFQETYAELKGKYAKQLVDNWHEVTDPAKHVFEDLGIAAFLIELWKDIYTSKNLAFPGFVDIGCGNGLLTHVLVTEGFSGWGFDIRKRKSWAYYPQKTQDCLCEKVLVPRLFLEASSGAEQELATDTNNFHDGVFDKGTFVISNHADELTAWTPILAGLSCCPFMAIPCCSHNLAGERFRAPTRLFDTRAGSETATTKDLRHDPEKEPSLDSTLRRPDDGHADTVTSDKVGSLKRPHGPPPPSQYAALCTYVTGITTRMQYVAEKELLRIPSTRKTAILGLKGKCLDQTNMNECDQLATRLVEELLSMDMKSAAERWISRANKIAGSKNSGH